MRRLSFPAWTFPFFVLVICGLAYAVLIPWLGFYQDDWYQVWFAQAFGTQVFVDFYSFERPFIALIYMLTTPLLDSNPTAWHIFALFTRWLAVLSLLWVLRKSWGRLSQPVMWLALLFAVYPGFRQQFAAVIYSHYFLQFAIQMVSIGVMIAAVRSRRWFWPLTGLALVLAAIGIFTSEYYFGLELTRPFFLWLEVARPQANLPTWQTKLRRLIRLWAPYLLLLFGFLIWRLLIFQFPTYQPFYESNPDASVFTLLINFFATALWDVFQVGLLAWLLPLQALLQQSLSQPSTLVALLLGAAGVLVVFTYLRLVKEEQKSDSPTGRRAASAGWLIAAGLASLLASGMPFWFVALPVDLTLDGGSRFGIAFMLGASLLIVGLLQLLPRRPVVQYGIVAVLVGLAVSQHFLDANIYRSVHQIHATFFQELRWRAPELEPGTLLITNQLAETLSGDNSMTAALNWVYDSSPDSLKYMLFYLPNRLEIDSLPALEPGLEVEKDFRTAVYRGSTDDALVVYFSYPQCLRVLDPVIEPTLSRPPEMPVELRTAAQISNLEQIKTDSTHPDRLSTRLFKYLPSENSWCYFFEKADLARQQGDWKSAAVLGDQALAMVDELDNTWEVLPYLEAYLHTRQYARADELIQRVFRDQPENRDFNGDMLCATLERVQDDLLAQPAAVSAIERLLDAAGCP